MPIKAILPSDLPDEITDLGANDYLIAQKSGASQLSKLKPAAIAPGDIGAAPKNGDAAQAFAASQLSLAHMTYGDTGLSYTDGWSLTASSDVVTLKAASQSLKNVANTDYITQTAKKFVSDTTASSPARTDIGFWLADYNSGISSNASNQLQFMVGSTAQGGAIDGEIFTKICRPTADLTYNCGTSSFRWNDVYSRNSACNTSDARTKKDVYDSDLGLEFIRALRPVSYRWKIGQYKRLVDENGEEYFETQPGVRPHYGLIAQEVKAALGDKDFAGYVYDHETDQYGLRTGEFIAPIIKAIQELAEEVASLKDRLEAAGF